MPRKDPLDENPFLKRMHAKGIEPKVEVESPKSKKTTKVKRRVPTTDASTNRRRSATVGAPNDADVVDRVWGVRDSAKSDANVKKAAADESRRRKESLVSMMRGEHKVWISDLVHGKRGQEE